MTAEEIESTIAKRENHCIELKESFGDECIETACAFANAQGGLIFVGVTDKGEPSKKPLKHESLRDYENRIATSTEPSVAVGAEKAEFRGCEIVVLRVMESPLKPVGFKGRCYVRRGSTNRQMTPAEIATAFNETRGGSPDAGIQPGVTKDDLDLETVRQYVETATKTGRKNFEAHCDPWTALLKTKLVNSESEITRAAYLLFAKNPQERYPYAIIRAAAFKDGCSEILDVADIRGNVQNQIDEAIAFIKRNIRCGIEVSGKAQNDRYWDYPIDSLREAIVNAVCHRDYDELQAVQIKILEDRLNIASPGCLPVGMSLEKLHDPSHSSCPRNKLLAAVFHDLGIIENLGSGIDRIKSGCRDNGNEAPEWRISEVEVMAVLKPRKRAHDTISETIKGLENESKTLKYLGKPDGLLGARNRAIGSGDTINDTINAADDTLKSKLCAALSQQGGLKRDELAVICGCSVPTVSRHIAELEHSGKVIYRGSKKTGGYYLQ